MSNLPRVTLRLALGLLVTASAIAGPALSPTPAHAARVYTTRTNVDTLPTGAEVRLVKADGTEEYIGVTPLKLYRLPRGNIRLKFTKAGYEELVQPVEIKTSIQTLVFNMVRSVAPAELEFISADAFRGAEVSVDGVPSGALPTSVKVAPGRHKVTITKDGYNAWDRWIEAAEGQKVSFDIVLTKVEAARGSILVTSTPSGAEVRLNGAPRGITPTVLEDLAPSPFLVEILLADHVPFSQTVNVVSAQRAILDAKLSKQKGDDGELKVLANMDDAIVFLDGEEIGRAPVTRGGIAPGTHLVEARNARGFRASGTAEVRAGEMTVVRLELTQSAPSEVADVRIAANVPGATVSIDGGAAVPLPHRATGLSIGTHNFEVNAEGFSPWMKAIPLAAGENPEIVAELAQNGPAEIRTKDGQAATIFLNGRQIGATPFVGELPVGTHALLLQRADGAQEEFRIAVASDRVVKVTAAFGEDAPKEEVVHRPMPMSARAMSANTGHVTAMTTILPTWAFPLMLEAGGGIGYGMDVGVRLRSAFDVINELEVAYKWTFAEARTVAAAIEAGIGGGLGADDRSSFVFRLTAKGSLLIGSSAAITARAGFLIHSDRVGPESDARTAERDSGVRLYLGLDVEFAVADFLNLMISLEGDPIGGNRELYLESFMADPEPRLYPRLGASFVF